MEENIPGKGSVIADGTREGQSPHPGTEAPLLVIEIGSHPITHSEIPHPISDSSNGTSWEHVTGVVFSHPPEVRAYTEAQAAELRGVDDV